MVRNRHSTIAPIALGAAAASAVELAIEKAAFEALHTRNWVASEQRADAALDSDNWNEDIVNFEDHVRFYAHPPNAHHADCLDASTATTALNTLPSYQATDPGSLWRTLVAELSVQGLDVGVFDMTSPDVREGGAHVSKVLVRGLMHMDAPYRAHMYGGQRVLQHAYHHCPNPSQDVNSTTPPTLFPEGTPIVTDAPHKNHESERHATNLVDVVYGNETLRFDDPGEN